MNSCINNILIAFSKETLFTVFDYPLLILITIENFVADSASSAIWFVCKLSIEKLDGLDGDMLGNSLMLPYDGAGEKGGVLVDGRFISI